MTNWKKKVYQGYKVSVTGALREQKLPKIEKTQALMANDLDESRVTSTTVVLSITDMSYPDYQMSKMAQPIEWGIQGGFSDGCYSSPVSRCDLEENLTSRPAMRNNEVLDFKTKSWCKLYWCNYIEDNTWCKLYWGQYMNGFSNGNADHVA